MFQKGSWVIHYSFSWNSQQTEYMASETLEYYIVPLSFMESIVFFNFTSKFLIILMHNIIEHMSVFTVLAFYKI